MIELIEHKHQESCDDVASRFAVSCENYKTKVFVICDRDIVKEVTGSLSNEDKDELINDLIYTMSELSRDCELATDRLLKEEDIRRKIMKIIYDQVCTITSYRKALEEKYSEELK